MARYPDISDHGLIGDLQTAALVTTDETLDWFCCAGPGRLREPSALPSGYRDPGHPVHDAGWGRRGTRFHAGDPGRGGRPAPAGAEHPGGPGVMRFAIEI